MPHDIECADPNCEEEGEEFFEYNEDEGDYFCFKHYGKKLDELYQLTPHSVPTDENGNLMWWNADTLTWCSVV